MNSVLPAFVVELVLLTWRDIFSNPTSRAEHVIAGLPLPADYLAAFVFYGALGLARGNAQRPAALTAWGITIATALNMWNPKNPLHVAPPSPNIFTSGQVPEGAPSVTGPRQQSGNRQSQNPTP